MSYGDITSRESRLTSIWCLVTRESDKPTEERKQMTAAVKAGALSRESELAPDEYREVDVITSAGPARGF